jgi:hypothetical protein
MKKYAVMNLNHTSDSIKFINQDTTSSEDICTTMWWKSKERNEDYNPLLFTSKNEAKRYLTEIKRHAKDVWGENSLVLSELGFRKPKWNIYEWDFMAECEGMCGVRAKQHINSTDPSTFKRLAL